MNKFYSLIVAILFAGCATTTNKSTEVPVTNVEMDYVVKERNPDPSPDWMKDYSKFKRDNDGHGNFYFIGESGDVSDRIAGCDMANLDAKKRISQELAQLVTHKIASDKQGRLAIDPNDSNDPGMQRAFESNLAAKSTAFLSGAKEYGTFWELRDYSKSGGNKRVFNCAVLVSISEKDMREAYKRTAQRAPEIIEDKAAKEAVTKSMTNIDADFNNYTNRTPSSSGN